MRRLAFFGCKLFRNYRGVRQECKVFIVNNGGHDLNASIAAEWHYVVGAPRREIELHCVAPPNATVGAKPGTIAGGTVPTSFR